MTSDLANEPPCKDKPCSRHAEGYRQSADFTRKAMDARDRGDFDRVAQYNGAAAAILFSTLNLPCTDGQAKRLWTQKIG